MTHPFPRPQDITLEISLCFRLLLILNSQV
jgi:hypothetical protein